MNFGERLKAIREEKGISQKELGARMGVTQQTIAQYEKAIDSPKLATIKRLANALDASFMKLAGDWGQYSKDDIQELVVAKREKYRDSSRKTTVFLNYLLSLGCLFVGTEDENGNNIVYLHLEDENIDIPLTWSEFRLLEASIADDVETRLYKLRKEKKI